MEKNSTKTVAKPTDKEQFRIFMQYSDQVFCYTQKNLHNGRDIRSKVEAFYPPAAMSFVGVTMRAIDLQYVSVELKSLGRISDEDFKMLATIFPEAEPAREFLRSLVGGPGYERKGIISYCHDPLECVEAIDFLRSKGYALPYMQWSVDELVSAGIYKLQNSSK